MHVSPNLGAALRGNEPVTLGACSGRRARGESKPGTISAEPGRPQAHDGRFLPTTWPGPSGSGPLGRRPMKRRRYALVLFGLLNFAWAYGLIALLRAGAVSSWLAWIVPLPIAAGGFVIGWAFAHLMWERA